jgi:hypothetical protein
MAVRVLTQKELQKFQKDIKQAEKDLENRETKCEEVYDKIE